MQIHDLPTQAHDFSDIAAQISPTPPADAVASLDDDGGSSGGAADARVGVEEFDDAGDVVDPAEPDGGSQARDRDGAGH